VSVDAAPTDKGAGGEAGNLPTPAPRRRLPEEAGAPGLIWSLQYLRAGAALAVVAYHALQWCDGGFDVGRAGVDVFFVISGVLMWTITAGREIAPRAFLWRRFTRVAPLYWIATLLVAAIAPFWPYFLPEVKPGWTHLALSLAFIPHLDPKGLPFPTLPPGWTLDYEMIFYVIFAAALFAPVRARARIVVGALFALVGAGFVFPDSAYYLGANPMLLQFAAGVGLGIALQRRRLPSAAWGAGLMAGSLLVWLLVQEGHLFTELFRPLVWGVPAAMLVAGALAMEAARTAPMRRGPLARAGLALGDASFSIYLFHLPATAVIAHAYGFYGQADFTLAGRELPFFLISMAASIGAGLAARHFVEKPLLAWARGLGRPASGT
jgi:exopolysaccharide production protein ExoZ